MTMDMVMEMDMTNIISTWIYCEKQGEEDNYPQVSGLSSSQKFQNVYWRCVAVYFCTARKFNPDALLILFTNIHEGSLPVVDGISLRALFSKLKVEVVTLPYTCRLARDGYNSWGNQFYIFDVLKYVSQCGRFSDNDKLVVLDSDCVWTQSGEAIFSKIEQQGLLAYEVYKSADYSVNGLSREDMREIYADLLGQAVPDKPVYYGGEWYAATVGASRAVFAEFEPLRDILATRLSAGKKVFNEEAHTLSYIYYKLGYASDTAYSFVKRIWTTLFVYENVEPEDFNLVIWHLPSEKRFGFKRLFSALTKKDASSFFEVDLKKARDYLGKYLGVPRRNPYKYILDVIDAVLARMSKIINR